jgi:hypothetical protein
MIPSAASSDEKEIIRVEQPSLGILTDRCSNQIMDFYDCHCPSGIQITKVFENSPLRKGKNPARDGDILCTIGGYEIDNNGECVVPWNREKVSFLEVFDRIALSESKIKVTYYTIVKNEITNGTGQNGGLFDIGKLDLNSLLKSVNTDSSNSKKVYTKFVGKMIEKNIPIVSAKSIFKIWNQYPPYDKVEYVSFGGIVMMNLAMNHIMMKEFQHLLYNYVNQLDKNAVLITKILPSSVKIDGLLNEGDIIVEVNGTPVSEVKDVDRALKNPINKISQDGKTECYMTFKTGLGKFYAIKLNKIVKEDVQLFQYFNYEPSQATKFFIKHHEEFKCLKESNNNSNNSFNITGKQ